MINFEKHECEKVLILKTKNNWKSTDKESFAEVQIFLQEEGKECNVEIGAKDICRVELIREKEKYMVDLEKI